MGSILRSTKGVGKYEMSGEGVVVVTFDDGKTTAAKIVKALDKGGFTVRGKAVNVKPGTSAPHGASGGKNSPAPHKSSGSTDVPPPARPPLYTTFPAAADRGSR